MRYVIQHHSSGAMGDFDTILEVESGQIIPIDERNSDYQRYLEWLAEGNVAEEVSPDQPPEVLEAN